MQIVLGQVRTKPPNNSKYLCLFMILKQSRNTTSPVLTKHRKNTTYFHTSIDFCANCVVYTKIIKIIEFLQYHFLMKFTTKIKIIKNTQVLYAFVDGLSSNIRASQKSTLQFRTFLKSIVGGNHCGFLTSSWFSTTKQTNQFIKKQWKS